MSLKNLKGMSDFFKTAKTNFVYIISLFIGSYIQLHEQIIQHCR